MPGSLRMQWAHCKCAQLAEDAPGRLRVCVADTAGTPSSASYSIDEPQDTDMHTDSERATAMSTSHSHPLLRFPPQPWMMPARSHVNARSIGADSHASVVVPQPPQRDAIVTACNTSPGHSNGTSRTHQSESTSTSPFTRVVRDGARNT